jgi:hypothetical protein
VSIQERINAEEIIVEDEKWTRQVLALGVLVGALTGLGGAYLLIQRSRKLAKRPDLNSREGLRLGLLIFGLLRQVASLGNDEK